MGMVVTDWSEDEDAILLHHRNRGLQFKDIRELYLQDRSMQALRQRVRFLVDEGLTPAGFNDPDVKPRKKQCPKACSDDLLRSLARANAQFRPDVHAHLLQTSPNYRLMSERTY